ncbi:MAG: electron transfer flavoprotein subunit alpha/FixB family protein [Bdellovibrionales bacterium]|nr:electron transfer flavoprotein subunit alpha/FixB family protein [Bdellovibrionales bacterium]
MSQIFVFLEAKDGKLKKGGLELLSWANTKGLDCSAGLIGKNLASAAEQAGHYGAKTVFTCETSEDGFNPEIFVKALKEMVETSQAKMILANASSTAKDVFPRLAAMLDSGVASDCTGIEIKDGQLVATKPLYSGKCTAEVEFEEGSLSMILMRSNQLTVSAPDESKKAEIKSISPATASENLVLEKVVQGASNKPDLTEANIIISGGRGMGEAKNFEVLEDLASAIGATVGASRAVVDAGWVPHGMQVGQTGKTVSPSLYIACGISGAIQHVAGMSGSKVIVAINKDGDAPIFQKASYGIVGDIFELAGPLKEEFTKALN